MTINLYPFFFLVLHVVMLVNISFYVILPVLFNVLEMNSVLILSNSLVNKIDIFLSYRLTSLLSFSHNLFLNFVFVDSLVWELFWYYGPLVFFMFLGALYRARYSLMSVKVLSFILISGTFQGALSTVSLYSIILFYLLVRYFYGLKKINY